MLALLVVFSFPVLAQSNDVALSAVGQFTHPVEGLTFGIPSGRQSSKNSFGMGVEYRHWFGNNGLSGEFSWVSSNATFPGWLMREARYKLNGAYVRRFNVHSFVSPFFSVGGGTFVTYGAQGTWSGSVHDNLPNDDSWWDNQPNATVGVGADIVLSRAFKLRIGNTLNLFRAPNFADPSYLGGRTFLQEPTIGLAYTWGAGRLNPR